VACCWKIWRVFIGRVVAEFSVWIYLARQRADDPENDALLSVFLSSGINTPFNL
jgi:hypothetical protein